MKKRKKSNILFTVLSLLVIALLVSLPFIIEDKKEESESAKVVSSVAETGTISKTLSGTGTLTAQDAEDVSVPSGVEITRYAVDNGDVVAEGAALAYVDRVSVMQAIASCQKTLEHIEADMASVARNAASEEITAPARGTVKAVYAQDGDDVRQVMLEHGALAVLEIEGKEWKAQAYTGTVFHTNAREGQTVYTGTTLFYLADTTDSSSFEILAAQHREYEDIMQTLTVLYQDGVVSAPCAGSISGIDEDAAAKLQQAYNKRYGLAETIAYNVPVNETIVSNDGIAHVGTIIKITDPSIYQYLALEDTINLNSETNFADSQKISSLFDKNSSDFTGNEPTNVYDPTRVIFIESITSSGWNSRSPSKNDVFLLLDEGNSNPTYAIFLGNYKEPSSPPGGGSDLPAKPDPGNSFDPSGFGDMGGMSGMGSFSGMGSGGAASAEKEEEYVQYSSEGTVCMSVTPQETISISITVDELDVLSVQKGSEAKLTIDAFPGREYTGTVTDLSRKATNSGGNSKYTAEITFTREDTMLPGMNASSLITVSTAEDVLMLPAKALTEDGLRTLVYTSYDEKTGLLSGEKEVTTGVSDGENVQILSGISEGDTVYYAYEDTIELESLFGGMPGAPGGFGGFPGGGGPSGGSFPGGPGRN